MWIAHIGRYKAFAIVGFGLAVVGFGMLAAFGPTTPYVVCWAAVWRSGVGVGMIFPTLTLSYQSAVEFSRARRGDVAESVLSLDWQHAGQRRLFGSILILRFVTGLQRRAPRSANWLDTSDGAGLRDPQSVLNPDASRGAARQVGNRISRFAGVSDLVLGAISDSLASALHLVFFIGDWSHGVRAGGKPGVARGAHAADLTFSTWST